MRATQRTHLVTALLALLPSNTVCLTRKVRAVIDVDSYVLYVMASDSV